MCHRFLSAGRSCRGVRAAWACVAVLLASAPVAVADGVPDVLNDSWQFALGSFSFNSDTDVQLNGDTQVGTNVNWENTFGDDDLTRVRLDGHWRFAERHKVRFMWFNSSRSESATLERDVEWGGVTFPVDTRIKGEFNFDIYELVYEYSFLRRETYELNASIGLHYTDVSWTLAARASSSGGTLENDIKEEASVGAPLPVIGLRGLWQLPYDLWVDAQAQFFALSIDEYDGNLQDYKVMLTWQPRKWLGFGIGYNQFSVDVDVDADNFDGSLDWTYKGPMLSYSAVF
jgi:hypothetical protein